MKTCDRASLVYIDQNIIGLLNEKRVKLEGDGFVWVYSDVHLEEIERGDCRQLLGDLARIEARRIVPVVENGKLTGDAMLHHYEDPVQVLERYLEAVGEVPFAATEIHDLLAALFGSNDEDAIRTIPERTRASLEEIWREIDQDGVIDLPFEKLIAPAKQLTDALLAKPVDLEKCRKFLGVRGVTNAFEEDENPLQRIWEILQETLPAGIDAEQFFGAKSCVDGEWEYFSPAQAVGNANTMLNHLGYRPDRKLAKASSWPNILSDSRHSSNASYCGFFLTSDMRLRSRARAIYRFFGIATTVVDFEMPAEGTFSVVTFSTSM